jgi:hypothetical protein
MKSCGEVVHCFFKPASVLLVVVAKAVKDYQGIVSE